MNENTKPTQADRVLARLYRGPLTQFDALLELGVMRLASRIHELRQRPGVEIHVEDVEVKTRLGETARIAQYRIVHEHAWKPVADDAWGSVACETCGLTTINHLQETHA